MGFWKNLFRRDKCKHYFHLLKLDEQEIEINSIPGIPEYYVEVVAYIYCSRCEKRRCVSELEWELISREQEIKVNTRRD